MRGLTKMKRKKYRHSKRYGKRFYVHISQIREQIYIELGVYCCHSDE